jgi:hypothetical protein
MNRPPGNTSFHNKDEAYGARFRGIRPALLPDMTWALQIILVAVALPGLAGTLPAPPLTSSCALFLSFLSTSDASNGGSDEKTLQFINGLRFMATKANALNSIQLQEIADSKEAFNPVDRYPGSLSIQKRHAYRRVFDVTGVNWEAIRQEAIRLKKVLSDSESKSDESREKTSRIFWPSLINSNLIPFEMKLAPAGVQTHRTGDGTIFISFEVQEHTRRGIYIYDSLSGKTKKLPLANWNGGGNFFETSKGHLLAGYYDKTGIILMDARTGEIHKKIPYKKIPEIDREPLNKNSSVYPKIYPFEKEGRLYIFIAWSPLNKNSQIIYDVEKGTSTPLLDRTRGALAYWRSPDGNRLFSYGALQENNSGDFKIVVTDVINGQPLASPSIHVENLEKTTRLDELMKFHETADGNGYLAIRKGNRIHLTDIRSGEETSYKVRFDDHGIIGFLELSDGTFLFVSRTGKRKLAVIDVKKKNLNLIATPFELGSDDYLMSESQNGIPMLFAAESLGSRGMAGYKRDLHVVDLKNGLVTKMDFKEVDLGSLVYVFHENDGTGKIIATHDEGFSLSQFFGKVPTH